MAGKSSSKSPATPPARFVLDGSVTLAWLFHDEQDPYADAIIARLSSVTMVVPRLWHLEVANVLAVSERSGTPCWYTAKQSTPRMCASNSADLW